MNNDTKEDLKQKFKESFLILMYEMIGTAMMTVLILNYYAQISFPEYVYKKPSHNILDGTA